MGIANNYITVFSLLSFFLKQHSLSLDIFAWFFTQVTEGKQDLEQALQLSRKLKEESLSLSKWLEATETELVQKSTSESLFADLDVEIAWAKVSRTVPFP